MVITSIDTDFFINLGELPPEVIALILVLLPKCMLPELLYCLPIRKIVASNILSNVNIIDEIRRHKFSDMPGDGYSECVCEQFELTLSNLKQGIRQWNVFPRCVHLNHTNQLENVRDEYPELLVDAQSINGSFLGNEDQSLEELLRGFFTSKFKFDSLTLSYFRNPLTIPPIATNVTLKNVRMNNYVIPGVKKLDISVCFDNDESHLYMFSPDLEDLRIYTERSMQVILPPNLRKLAIVTESYPISFISEEMVNLKHLLLLWPGMLSFEQTGIEAPNLETLILESINVADFTGLQNLEHLKQLEVVQSIFPIGLFNEGFPELEMLLFSDCIFPDFEDFNNSSLIFSSNLKELRIKNSGFSSVHFSNFVQPPTLKILDLDSLSFNYEHLGENLLYIHVRASKATLKSDFRIPPMTEKFTLNASYLTFESMDFMYHLPTNLASLHLSAKRLGKLYPITQMVEWPLKMSEINFKNLNIDYFKLKQLNLNESGLTKIYISGGDVKKLDAGLFPVSVKDLSLTEMGIQQLPDSFENLKNLQKLSLQGNQLREVTSVKLPMATLETLDVNQCNLRLISPFVVSMLEEKNKNAKLRVYAIDNVNVSVIDIRRVLKAIKGLSLVVSKFDKTLTEISKHSSRLHCQYTHVDHRIKQPEIDDLYNGSDSGSDEESSVTKNKRRKI